MAIRNKYKRKQFDWEKYLDYISGSLKETEQYEIEESIAGDAFEDRALEGLTSIAPLSVVKDIAELRINLNRKSGYIYSEEKKKTNRVAYMAVLIALLVSVLLLWLLAGPMIIKNIPQPTVKKIVTVQSLPEPEILTQGELLDIETPDSVQTDTIARKIPEPIIMVEPDAAEIAKIEAEKQLALAQKQREEEEAKAKEAEKKAKEKAKASVSGTLLIRNTKANLSEYMPDKYSPNGYIHYIGEIIAAKHPKYKGVILVGFDLDKSGRVQNIKIRNVNDVMMVRQIENTIQNGPAWRAKEDKLKPHISIEIKVE